jgi:predicted ATP-dependent endonuclease of OLD family
LGLDKIILISKTGRKQLSELNKDTIEYFKKLPGYETLRAVIASKVILVEGPTDELIVQSAYLKMYGKLPISDGIDIISVKSLAFKRFCDIAVLLKKPIAVLTDNDGDIVKNITDKYSQYDKNIVMLFYEKNQNLNTLEPSFIEANKSNINKLKCILKKSDTMSEDDLKAFMLNNKTDWAMAVFDNFAKFEYPECINECIKYIKK